MKLQDIDRSFCTKRSSQGASRKRLGELVQQSMYGLEMSRSQRQAHDQFLQSDSVVAITGQQTGLLGGPMYTLYKVRSAVAATSFVTQHTGVPCVPVFWIEDNDHDAQEAMHTHVLTHAHDVVNVSPWDGADPRRRVADRILNQELLDSITSALPLLHGRFSEQTVLRLQRAYVSGTSWTDAFLGVLAPYLAEWGVLVIRSSVIVDSGLHSPILQNMLIRNNEVLQTIKSTTASLLRDGQKAQATILDVPWMYTDSEGRQRIEKTPDGLSIAGNQLSFDQLLEMARLHAHKFTPTVLTRPLIQDALLPTVVSVLGVAELAYHQQIADVYPLLGIGKPTLQKRSGGVLLTPKVKRNLLKSDHKLEWFCRPWHTIEQDLSKELASTVLPNRLQQQQIIDQALDNYAEAAQIIDPTLIATVNAQRSGMQASLEMLEAKLTSALKKKNAVILDRAHAIHASVYPNDTLQERMFPLAMWEAELGIDGVIQACEEISLHEIGTSLVFQAPSQEAQ